MAFNATLETISDTAKITLSGELDASTAPSFKEEVEKVASQNVKKLVLLVKDLDYMSSAGLRVFIFAKQKMGAAVDIYIVGANEMVMDTIEKTGFHHSIFVLNEYDTAQFETV
jgi:anti-anti-sigma factor